MATISTSFDPLRHADPLGGALQQQLPRPTNPRLCWSLIRTLVIGGFTGGIGPVWLLPGRFKRFVESERMQYWHLAEWMRLRGVPEAATATQISNEMMPAFWLPLLAKLFAVVAIGIALSAVRAERFPAVNGWQAWNQLLWSRVQLQHRHHPKHFSDFVEVQGPNGQRWEAPATIAANATPDDLILPFNLAIAGACLCWLMQINGHIGRVKKFVYAFNRSTARFGIGSVRPPGWNIGFRPVWLFCGIALASIGGYWAIPLMLASAAQRSYIIRTTHRLRGDLARRQRDVLLAQRPAVHVPASSYLMSHCPQPNCRAPLPPEATYCRRCGSMVNSTPGDPARAGKGA